ncbi:MAG: SLC13 family permease [Anaerolineales bacterium]|nr:SLC13 family permease [Anaerolineales bacterium]
MDKVRNFAHANRQMLSMALVFVFLASALGSALAPQKANAQQEAGIVITGRVLNTQGQSIEGARVMLHDGDENEIAAQTETGEEGVWTLEMARLPEGPLELQIERQHYQRLAIPLNPNMQQDLDERGALLMGEIELERRITSAFWAATLIFLGVLLVIAFEKLHSTTAALAGLSAVFLFSVIGGAFNTDFFIYDFERALTYINWEVIFLIMGMMILIAVIEGTGIFQWTAFQAYRLSRGRAWLLVLILMAVTAVASALLDNFTTMLLMTPISLQIGLALGINPLAFIIPEVLASNVGGITTLIGTPTNILIGAYADISFQDFLVNQTVGVLLALVGMAAYVMYHYRHELRKHPAGISETLYARLESNARIRDPQALWKSGLVFVLVLVGFIVGEQFHVVPAVPAIIGATALLVWLRPDVHAMIKAVDWTTLVFFMALFMVVGAVQEVGFISMIAVRMAQMIGENLILGIAVIVFGVGTLSVAIANIPLAASMLPVAEFLSGSIPGASSKVLYYALSMGAAMGGNGLLIGGEANLVTAGIASQAGSPISFKEFMKVGLPVTYITLTAGFLWLLFRFGM